MWHGTLVAFQIQGQLPSAVWASVALLWSRLSILGLKSARGYAPLDKRGRLSLRASNTIEDGGMKSMELRLTETEVRVLGSLIE